MSPPVLFLMGATATGKTELAIELGERFGLEIVSVDSAQVYRGMDIGTAKPTDAERAAVPHHLIDLREPTEAWSAWDFVVASRGLIEQIDARGRGALLAGGTMLYFNAFEQGLSRLPPADPELRARLEREAAVRGWPALHARLAEVDPASAARIEAADAQRIQRALEVHELTGAPLSQLHARRHAGYPGPVHRIILDAPDRARLHARIERRFHAMLELGLIDEVERLRARGDLHPALPSMRAVGYRQVWRYLDGETSRDEMIDAAVAATRQLAKRQLTWLRKQPREQAFDCLNYRKDDIFRQVERAYPRA